MHAHINHTTSLSMCYCDMFHPSMSHLQGARLTHFHGQINKMFTRREIQFIEQLILCFAVVAFWSNTVLIKWCETVNTHDSVL